MATADTKTELLKVHEQELVKQYIVYDAASRPQFVYTAATEAIDQAPCLVTEYEYETVTSPRVVKRKESNSTWDASWDI